MEQFDIFDISGKPTGLIANKGTRLSNGQYYLGVHAYIYNPSLEFLLQQRSYDKEFLPGGWDVHLGHVVAGETSMEGIVREIQEEIGLTVPENDIYFSGRIVWEEYHHMIDIYFLETDFDLNNLTLQCGEVIGAKLVSKGEILELVSNMYYRPEEYRRLVIGEIDRLPANNCINLM